MVFCFFSYRFSYLKLFLNYTQFWSDCLFVSIVAYQSFEKKKAFFFWLTDDVFCILLLGNTQFSPRIPILVQQINKLYLTEYYSDTITYRTMIIYLLKLYNANIIPTVGRKKKQIINCKTDTYCVSKKSFHFCKNYTTAIYGIQFAKIEQKNN